MKNILYSFVLILITSYTGYAQLKDKAIDYNDMLIKEELAVIERINTLEAEFATYDPIKIEPALNAALRQTDYSINVLENVKPFHGSRKFRNETLNLLYLFKKQLEEDYPRMLAIYKLSDDEYTSVQEKEYNDIIQKIDDEYQPQYKKFTDSQNAFADKYGFTLN